MGAEFPRAQLSGIPVLHCFYSEQPACWSSLPICNSLPPGQVSSLSSPWVVFDGFIASPPLFLWALARSSSRRLEPSSMEVEPKKLKGKRDLIVTKSFQQVDFWCK